jgi:hypothetical protein
LSPTSAPCGPCTNNPSIAGFITRTNVPCDSGNDGIEGLTDSAAHRDGSDPLRPLSLSLSRCIFFQRTLVRDCSEFVV